MQADLFRRESGLYRRIKFTAGHDVHTDPLACGNFIDGRTGKSLGGIQNKALSAIFFLESIFINAAHIADVIFVHHIKRRAELLCQLHRVGAADLKVPLFVHFQSFAFVHMSLSS